MNFSHFQAKYQGYSLTFWPKLPHFHHFSICSQTQPISIVVIFRQNTKAIALLFGQNCLIFITFQSAVKLNQFQVQSLLGKIPRLQPYFLAKIASFSSLFNLQSNSTNLNFSHCQAKCQGYSLTIWPKLPHFHHFSICSQTQPISIVVIFRQNTKAIALLFGQNCLIFITFQSAVKLNQIEFQSFLGKIPRLQPYFLAKIASFSSLFNLQSNSTNFNFNHFQAKYQGYSLTFWPKLPHFHHFSICSQTQPISILIIFRQNTKAIALLFGQNCLIFITFQSAVKLNQFEFQSFLGKLPRLQPYFLAKIASFSSLFNLNSNSSKLNFSQCQAKYQGLQPYFLAKNASFSSLFNLQSNSTNLNFSHFQAKYQGYSLTFWPKLPHFHHFSICSQTQPISIVVIFRQNTKAIALLFGQNCLISITFQSEFKLKQIEFQSMLGKIPRLIAVLFGQKCLIFITFQSVVKLNQFEFQSFLGKIPRLQPYFLAKIASFSSLFNLQSNSTKLNFSHLQAKYQGYSLTFWPKLPHFHHFSICSQTQPISILVIFRQNTKAIALLFGQNCLIFITFQSAVKLNQFQVQSFLGKLPRLQPYFLAKIASFSSLFNLQSNSTNLNFSHLQAQYQDYSLTIWPKLPHCHHF